MIDELLKAAQAEVDSHSIYVWGASGQLCCQVTEALIRKQEARNENGKHADDAVKAWEAVMASPYRDVARCFDCSGYVSWCLKQCGAFSGRTDCDGLFARSTEIYTPEDGCLLFRVNPSKPSDETHVGIYAGGKQYHAKGRAYGVVCEPYNERYWQKLAWFKALKPDPDPEPTPEPPAPAEKLVKVIGGSVRVRDGNGAGNVQIGTAHNAKWYKEHGINKPSDTFPLIRQCEEYPYWYCIEYKGQIGYITSLPRYTEVIEK